MDTILITGAGRGIGLGLAERYVAGGWRVIATVRPGNGWNGPAGVEVTGCDVRSADSVSELVAILDGQPLDVLVNNAGVLGPERQSAVDMDFEGFADVLLVNTLGPLRMAQALLPHLRAGQRPRIVNVSSRMGSLSYAKSDTVAYRASKAALNKVTQCLATDLAPIGIAVAAVHPGWVRTNIGGGSADMEVSTSVEALQGVIDSLDLSATGSFLNYDGTMLDW